MILYTGVRSPAVGLPARALVGFGLWLLLLAAASGLHAGVAPAALQAASGAEETWVTVKPPEYLGAINNPLMGFRAYKKGGFGLLRRQYIKWNDIEIGAGDTVDRIIAHTNRVTLVDGVPIEQLNVKLVPRVYLDWNGVIAADGSGRQFWPADLHAFDYDSPEFQARLLALVGKLGKAWDEDPRIFAVQMGLIGRFGEHHNPAPTVQQRRLLTEAFRKAFRNKPVLVRHTDPEFMAAGFGIYYDTFANLSREPPDGDRSQFPWQATNVYPDIWKNGPIEGEVEYNWQERRESAKPESTFGRTPDQTLLVPAYRRYMMDKIRRYHASYLGWIDQYDDSSPKVLEGAAELQKAFGYRFVIDSVSYPPVVHGGGLLRVRLAVRNTGSAPFYLDWPVAVGLLDPKTKAVVWSAPLQGVDIRRWMPGEDWDGEAFAYRKPAITHSSEGSVQLQSNLRPGNYILALALLDRQGGMMPSARFSTMNYFRGGWHPMGYIGVGRAPESQLLKDCRFDDPAFDDSLHYSVPASLRAVRMPPVPAVQAVGQWVSDPKGGLINPWRYWMLQANGANLELGIGMDGPVETPAGRRVIRVAGEFGGNPLLIHLFGNGTKLAPGRYRMLFRARGSAGQAMEFELADGGRTLSKGGKVPLAPEWTRHRIEFEVTKPFSEESSLRFRLPQAGNGFIEITDAWLGRLD